MAKWEVRPSMLLTAPATNDDTEVVARFLGADAADGEKKPGVGLVVGPLGGQAITTSLVIECATAGEACEAGIDMLRRACESATLAVGEIQEVVIEPGWRDSRTW